DCRDPEAEPAPGNALLDARGPIVETDDPLGEAPGAVVGIERPAREDGCTRSEHGPARAFQHQDVQIRPVGDEDHRGRVACGRTSEPGVRERRVRLGSDSSHPYSLRGASRPKPGPLTCCSSSSSQLQVVFGKQASPFGLREAAPDAVGLANTECEFEAVLANAALRTDVLRVLLTRLAVVATFRCRR